MNAKQIVELSLPERTTKEKLCVQRWYSFVFCGIGEMMVFAGLWAWDYSMMAAGACLTIFFLICVVADAQEARERGWYRGRT